MHTKICPVCNGTGNKTCPHCASTDEKWPNACPWCRGTKSVPCGQCIMGKVEPDEPRRSMDVYELHNEWVALAYDVMEAQQKPDTKPTKRFATALTKAIDDPNVHVSWNPSKDGSSYQEIIIWVFQPINEFQDALHLIWHGGWAGLAEELERCDQTDVLERVKAEQACRAYFDQIDGQIANLEEQIDVLRKAANERIEALPVPQSATLRKEHSPFWTHPTFWARSLFTHIWPK